MSVLFVFERSALCVKVQAVVCCSAPVCVPREDVSERVGVMSDSDHSFIVRPSLCL